MEQEIKGIGKKHRLLLSKVLRSSKGCINVQIVQAVLDVTPELARKYLSRWAKRGWLKRVHHGKYLPVSLETEDISAPSEDPWVIAEGIFSPCYVGGWSAVQYWDFTEQLFNQTLVFTSRKLSPNKQEAGGHHFILTRTSEEKMIGLKTVWKDGVKVKVSDPHKTIIDILDHPKTGGGIRSVCDFLVNYLNSTHKNLDLLIEYASHMRNGTIFKRLGYLLSIFAPEEKKMIAECHTRITKGNTQLDPSISGTRLIKKWGLWIPEGVGFND